MIRIVDIPGTRADHRITGRGPSTEPDDSHFATDPGVLNRLSSMAGLVASCRCTLSCQRHGMLARERRHGQGLVCTTRGALTGVPIGAYGHDASHVPLVRAAPASPTAAHLRARTMPGTRWVRCPCIGASPGANGCDL